MHHVDDAADEVAVAVGEVAVVALDQCVEGEVAVLAEGNFAQQEIAQGIGAEDFVHGFGTDDIAARLGHLALIEEQPAVGPYGARHSNAGGHEKGGPVDAMEAADFFADEVHVGGPEFGESRLVGGIIGSVAEGGDVVGQSVEPDVDHLLFVAWHGDAPGEAGAADGEIFESAANEGDDFAARGLGLHEAGIGLVKLEQLAFEGGELEEIIFFADGLGDAAAVRARRAGSARRPTLHRRRNTGRCRSLCRCSPCRAMWRTGAGRRACGALRWCG